MSTPTSQPLKSAPSRIVLIKKSDLSLVVVSLFGYNKLRIKLAITLIILSNNVCGL